MLTWRFAFVMECWLISSGVRSSPKCVKTHQSKYDGCGNNRCDRPSLSGGSDPDQKGENKNPAKIHNVAFLPKKHDDPPCKCDKQRQSQYAPPTAEERQYEEVNGKEQKLPPNNLKGTESVSD